MASYGLITDFNEDGSLVSSELAQVDSVSLTCSTTDNEDGKYTCLLIVAIKSKDLNGKFRMVVGDVVKDVTGNKNIDIEAQGFMGYQIEITDDGIIDKRCTYDEYLENNVELMKKEKSL